MNQLLARAALRGLNSGRSFTRCASPSTAVALAAVVERPFDGSVVMWRGQDLRSIGVARNRTVSTVASDRTTVALATDKDQKERAVAGKDGNGSTVAEKKKDDGEAVVSSYWGISRPKITKKDGTEWPWNCFMPWDTYQSNLSIDLGKHHVPKTFLDKVAYRTVKVLRIPTDIFFQRRYGCRAMMLETVAAVPGMVGGMLLHLRSLRKFQQSGGWIKALLEEAENERMHLMTMVELVQPKWYERLLVLTVQGVFFNAFFVLYLLSPKLAHRIVGYLEEEAIHSYTEYLKDIDDGKIENVPAPAIAIDYWRLPKDGTLKDVITVIRADEAHHRDVNHFASVLPKIQPLHKDTHVEISVGSSQQKQLCPPDIHHHGKELRDAPAPLGYH
ncbi:ubiquinol oxidase (non-electrogenic) [Sarracenia purpurea var. burkii]